MICHMTGRYACHLFCQGAKAFSGFWTSVATLFAVSFGDELNETLRQARRPPEHPHPLLVAPF